MSSSLKRALFGFFVLSGFSGLLYQIIWVRMALASFGVITPFASVVVSVFMLGLALGTWLGGRFASPLADRWRVSPILLYGAAELVIGVGAFALPLLFAAGRALLLPIGAMNSHPYLLLSSLVITLSMLPWCICMGATFPTMMAFIERAEEEPSGSFSFLYLANVIGAMLGAVATSVALIELLGFSRSLWVAACLNGLIALGCWQLARRHAWRERPVGARAPQQAPPGVGPLDIGPGLCCGVLFITGFTSMALEIVWMRAFTPVLGTLVYAFSGLLTVYLFATWLGSYLYRRRRGRGRLLTVRTLVCLLALTVMLPVVVAIPRNLLTITALFAPLAHAVIETRSGVLMIPITLLSILPFCALLGYLTPMLIDHYSHGGPERAGRAYAINIAGSILGPLAAAYLLLPWLGARLSMVLLALPFAVLFLYYALQRASLRQQVAFVGVALLLGVSLVQTGFYGRSFEEGSHIATPVVRRDHTATVISYGKGFERHLLVNGYGMTVLTPLTKIMAHLPLASLDHPPESALVIAFGMGTTFRSLLSWGIDTTAVELVPSVVEAFDYYHADTEAVLQNPRGRIVIDDGRRFLARSEERFDLITIDPPPPVETAGSSLLYAEEFYALAKARLAPDGIVQQWFPDGIKVEPAIRQAVLRSILNSFSHVRVFQSMHGHGLHVLCSMQPIEVPAVEEFVARLPEAARRDLMEWAKPGRPIRSFIQSQILDKELDLAQLVSDGRRISVTDDRPYNEYFALRRLLTWTGHE